MTGRAVPVLCNTPVVRDDDDGYSHLVRVNHILLSTVNDAEG